MGKNSFILHTDSLDILSELTDEQAGLLFKAISKYQKTGETDLDGIMKALFIPFKNQFDRDSEKYQKICERNKSNGLNGGRPKENKAQNNPVGYSETQPIPKKADSDNDSKSDSDNELEKEDTKVSSKKQKSSSRGTRMTEDWFLSQELGEWAMQQGFTGVEVERQAEKFKDWWIAVAGAKGVKKDWDATWRTWIRNAQDWRK